jgi:hypothetical protein
VTLAYSSLYCKTDAYLSINLTFSRVLNTIRGKATCGVATWVLVGCLGRGKMRNSRGVEKFKARLI